MAHQTTQANQGRKPLITPVSTEADRMINDREVAHLLGVSRSWPWTLAREGKFPAPIKISHRCTRWWLSSVREWMADPQGWQAANKVA
ncbi:helix-turn-helix transcriptional regulator [Eoetvoesiella caeni]|uniref:AlpA family transcriptional regulator n=1 Tax=Eoetvoesiella caeni TaxID=645616 RepID=A0A366H944_9BURK|nr:AlpA family phage regulatory protein [Eoetvoesiella caeni]MCI2809530.1 AlpA family phage regulatory protein [Eoetvoesiella caeni]NYT56026.1 AlpA family phage regulatory protein [Eoetvoesiella caeni]RBP38789.1 AlpA family transcriptional regulator [Eoetvoesiella caeni]